VSAFAAENQITLGEITVDEKSNKIKAIPELLDLLDVAGANVTIDALGCQTDIDCLPQKTNWKKLNAIGAVKSSVYENENTRIETRYFITSLSDVHHFVNAARKHWSVENQLHWQLDVTFGEDSSRARKDNSPLNLNVL
jgi:predicted transposase YbfD/YdcC